MKFYKDPKKIWLIAAISGLIATYSLYNVYIDITQTVTVYTPKTEVMQGQKMDQIELVPVKIPKKAAYADSVTRPEDLVGFKAKGYIPAGTYLRKSMVTLLPTDSLSGKLTTKFKNKDKKAIALPSTLDTTIGNSLRTGDIIELYAQMPRPNKDGSVTPPILIGDDIEVLFAPVPSNGDQQTAPQGNSVILALSEEQIQALFRAQTEGRKFIVVLKPQL